MARALLIDRPILAFDEPFAALDSQSADIVCRALNELKKKSAVLVVSHIAPSELGVDRALDFSDFIGNARESVTIGSPSEARAKVHRLFGSAVPATAESADSSSVF